MTAVDTTFDLGTLEPEVGTTPNPDDITEAGFTFFVDVSAPGDVDFMALRAAGCKAVIFQTGDGLGEEFANEVPAQLAPRARDAGLHVGFYHYNRARRLAQGNVADEARWMKKLVDRAGGLRPGVDLRIVMDVEALTADDIAVDVAEFTRQLRDELRVQFGHEPLLYSGWEFAKARLGSVGGDIWVAWYPDGGQSFGVARDRWHENLRDQAQLGALQPVAWQYGGDVNGGVPGVGRCDVNIAPAEQFATLLIPTTQPAPSPQPADPPPQPSGTPVGTITAANGRTILTMQEDGNLVVYRDSEAVWATGTDGRGRAAFLRDGELVVSDGSATTLWASGTAGHPGAELAVQDDGNIVLYDGGQPLWATNTTFSAPVTVEADVAVGVDWAQARIDEWNFRHGVVSFQEAFTGSDLVVDGDLGQKTADAVRRLVDAGGQLSEHFHLDEFRCKHCGRARVNRELVRALERLRAEVGPLQSISSYRCEDHEIEAKKPTPGQHSLGTAWDPDPYLPRAATEGKGFSGRGHTQADDGIISHLDVRHAGPANITGSSPDDPAEFEDN